MSNANIPISASPEAVRIISRKTVVRSIVAAAMIAAGVVAMHTIERAFEFHFSKTPMPLNKPLPLLKKELGFPTRYITEGFDENMSEAILEVLGTRDYLLRNYRDLQKSPGDPAENLKINLNYYAVGSAMPHVPEVCWAGSGMVEAQCSRKVFEVANVRRKDGSEVTLRVRLISFLPAHESENSERLKNVAYVFNVNGEYVPTSREVVSRFWRATNKYAYDTKIEVTVGKDQQYCSQERAMQAVSDFLRASLADIEECLPNTASATEAGNQYGSGTPTGTSK